VADLSKARASNRAYVAPITDVSVSASDVGRRGVVGWIVLVGDWRDVDVWSAALWVGLYGGRTGGS
jgi:hypothetical protein